MLNERVNRLKEASFPQRAGPDMNIQFSQEHQICWRTWRSGSGLRENFLSAGAIQTPTGSVAGGRAGSGWQKKKKKAWRFCLGCFVVQDSTAGQGKQRGQYILRRKVPEGSPPPQYTRDGTRAQLCRGSKSKTDPRSPQHSLMARPQALCNLILSSQHPGRTGIPD